MLVAVPWATVSAAFFPNALLTGCTLRTSRQLRVGKTESKNTFELLANFGSCDVQLAAALSTPPYMPNMFGTAVQVNRKAQERLDMKDKLGDSTKDTSSDGKASNSDEAMLFNVHAVEGRDCQRKKEPGRQQARMDFLVESIDTPVYELVGP